MAVCFHLPGFANNYKLNMLFARFMLDEPHRFRDGVKIASVYGVFPPSLWNGGRFENGNANEPFIRGVIRQFNSIGIPLRFTFTNVLLKEEDLRDPHCNFCLQAAHNGMNEVVVVSETLENYIRKNYPRYKFISSTCKQIHDLETLNAELDKDYKLVVLDYSLNNKFDVLEKIKLKSKCEFLCFEVCIPNCPRRTEHQENTSLNTINLVNSRKSGKPFEPIEFPCQYGERNTFYDIQGYETFISPDALYEKYVPMGFNNFKLEGRTADPLILLDFYVHYTCKPEFRDKTRVDLTMLLKQNGVYRTHYSN